MSWWYRRLALRQLALAKTPLGPVFDGFARMHYATAHPPPYSPARDLWLSAKYGMVNPSTLWPKLEQDLEEV